MLRACRICKKEKELAEYNKGWLGGLSPNCRDCDRERGKKYYHRSHNSKKEKVIKRLYGIEFSEYLEILESQGGVCKICGSKEKLCIDHDHSDGKIRGILCSKCNLALGYMGDDVDRLEAAIVYLSACR